MRAMGSLRCVEIRPAAEGTAARHTLLTNPADQKVSPWLKRDCVTPAELHLCIASLNFEQAALPPPPRGRAANESAPSPHWCGARDIERLDCAIRTQPI